MAESINLSFGFIGGEVRGGKIRRSSQEISLNEALVRIKGMPITQEEKNILSGVVKKAPNGSLSHILSNYRNHLKK